MYIRTKSSDPAHPHFIFGIIVYQMRNRRRTPKKSSNFQKKLVYEQKYRLQLKYFSGINKNRIRLMISAIIKKARQDEKQNQTTTTNLNYIQNLCQFKICVNFLST